MEHVPVFEPETCPPKERLVQGTVPTLIYNFFDFLENSFATLGSIGR